MNDNKALRTRAAAYRAANRRRDAAYAAAYKRHQEARYKANQACLAAYAKADEVFQP